MAESISAADANRRFSRLIRGVREGNSYVVTSHGKPVARIVPAGTDERVSASAKASLLTRLRGQKATKIGRWTRDELYDETR